MTPPLSYIYTGLHLLVPLINYLLNDVFSLLVFDSSSEFPFWEFMHMQAPITLLPFIVTLNSHPHPFVYDIAHKQHTVSSLTFRRIRRHTQKG